MKSRCAMALNELGISEDALKMGLFCGLGAERICCTGFPFDKIFYCPIYTMDCLQGQGNHFVIWSHCRKILPASVAAKSFHQAK